MFNQRYTVHLIWSLRLDFSADFSNLFLWSSSINEDTHAAASPSNTSLSGFCISTCSSALFVRTHRTHSTHQTHHNFSQLNFSLLTFHGLRSWIEEGSPPDSAIHVVVEEVEKKSNKTNNIVIVTSNKSWVVEQLTLLFALAYQTPEKPGTVHFRS